MLRTDITLHECADCLVLHVLGPENPARISTSGPAWGAEGAKDASNSKSAEAGADYAECELKARFLMDMGNDMQQAPRRR